MALVEHWRTDFDSDAKTNKFFYSPAPGGLANIADVRRVTQDGVSCIEINIGDETPTVEYFCLPNGGTDAYDRMVADVANQSNGAVAYCYSRDSAKHGRYVKGASTWGSRTGSVTPKMADDKNHMRVAQVRLLLQSYSEAHDPVAPPLLGYPDFAELNDSIGLPATRDLSGWTMRWTMRAIGMSMGRRTKIFQHFQTRTDAPRVGSFDWDDGGPTGSAPFVNAGNVATCISDQLGFGGDGLFASNAVDYVADSGWVDIDIPLEPLWSHWLMLGGNDGEPGSDIEKMGRLPYDKAVRYIVADPAKWVRDWSGNAYVMEGQFNQNPDADAPVIPDGESVRGRLLVSSLSFLREAA